MGWNGIKKSRLNTEMRNQSWTRKKGRGEETSSFHESKRERHDQNELETKGGKLS